MGGISLSFPRYLGQRHNRHVSPRSVVLCCDVIERHILGFGSHLPMLLRSWRKGSGSFIPPLTTFTLFVAIRPIVFAAVDRYPRIAVPERGLAIFQPGTVGVTHSRPGKRYRSRCRCPRRNLQYP